MELASLSPVLQVALKEWAAVCSALGCGRQIILLRKGGVADAEGRFEIQHRQFLLFPTYLHQTRRMLKPEACGELGKFTREPHQVKIVTAGLVTDVLRVDARSQMDALDAHHIWTGPMLDKRFAYKPEAPLYLLLIRAYRLREPVVIENLPQYEGCKSWVPLEAPIQTASETATAQPALDDAAYAAECAAILAALGAAPPGDERAAATAVERRPMV